MSLIITREYLISLLYSWKNNKINAEDIYNTANILFNHNDIKFLDWEFDNQYSVSLEVLKYLESLDLNLVIQQDINYFIEFLNTKIGDFNSGYKIWDEYLKSINYETRKKMLKDIYPYSTVCQFN
jgi:hypothetical protein